MSAHDAIAALPVGANGDKALERALLTRRYAYCLDIGEAATSFVAVDPASGVLPLYITQNNIMFRYDSTDSTTANDGVTCLVSSDGKRYKSATIAPPWSVISRTLTAPPGSPAIGDSYIVAVAATGAWAGKDNNIAIFTASGWVFVINPVGKSIYVQAETAFYYRAVSGTWTRGAGTLAFGSNSVAVSNIIGQGVRWFVVNQTTNTPPGSPSIGDAYVIGPSPTGAWAGNAAKIAICESGTTFTIYSPRVGERVYDAAQAADYGFNGTAWQTQTGNWIMTLRVYSANATWTKPARLFQARICLVGGGGGNGSTAGSTAGTTSFGSHVSATGGTSGLAGPTSGAGGTGTGGDINAIGLPGLPWHASLDQRGTAKGLGIGTASGSNGQGGDGGSAEIVLQASALGASEAVTIGAAGGAGPSGTAGTTGHMTIEEYTNA